MYYKANRKKLGGKQYWLLQSVGFFPRVELVNGWSSWHFQWLWSCHTYAQENQHVADGLATVHLSRDQKEAPREELEWWVTVRGGQESIFDLGGKRITWLKQFIQELISRATRYLANDLFSWIGRYTGNKSNMSLRMNSLISWVLYLLTEKQILLRTQLEISFHLLCSPPAFPSIEQKARSVLK